MKKQGLDRDPRASWLISSKESRKQARRGVKKKGKGKGGKGKK
ncbi:MAG: hypothetical protein RBR16_13545 [Syntrophus sp. (in: bacteria)]|nr:hypothetical protein [Syntrophus sp. (in: bacteria)]